MTAQTPQSSLQSSALDLRLRIAVLNRVFSPTGGGAERYSIALVEALSHRHDIHVFAQTIEHHWPGVTYHRVSRPFSRPRWVNQLWYACLTWWATRKGFDLVHSHENTWHGQVQTLHVLPVRYTLFDGRAGFNRALTLLKVALSPRLLTYLGLEWSRLRAGDGRQIVVASQTLGSQVEAVYPALFGRLTVITPGVNLPKEANSPALKSSARTALGLPAEGFGILFVANDYKKKGLQTLMEALTQQPADVFVFVVGRRADEAVFKQVALGLGLAKRVVFLGPQEDMHRVYQAADCLAHPTREDTFAMVVLEAMVHGLPVVVSGARYCGIASSLITTEQALILDDPLDASALADFLLQLQRDGTLRQRLSEKGYEYACQHQWPLIADQLERLYRAQMTRAK